MRLATTLFALSICLSLIFGDTSEEILARWLRNHRLVAQQVWCNKKKYRGNKELSCVCDGEFWYCPDLETNGCRARYSIMEPLFSEKSKRDIKDTLQILYSLAQGIAVKHILRESTLSRVTVMAVTQMLEFIIAMAHDMRFDAAEGTVVFMQKDLRFQD